MAAGLLLALILAATVVAFRGPPPAAATVLVAMWLLVPGSARVPGTGTGQLMIHRVLLGAVIAGLAWRAVSGRVDRRAFALRGVHLAFAAFLIVAALLGVVLADIRTLPRHNLDGWVALAEQAVFFVTALAVFRLCGARRSVEVITAVGGLLAVIAISERVFGWSYARWFAAEIADPSGLLTLPLERRGSHPRVRGAATFALEFAWIVALLVPVTMAGALNRLRGRSRPDLGSLLHAAVPVLLLMALVWSWSRSAYAGLAIGVAALLVGVVLDRPRQLAIVSLACVAVVALAFQAPLQEAIEISTASGEQDVRFQRLPEVLEPVAERPLVGLGLGGLLAHGVQVVDNSWVTTYATLGVVGVMALGALLLAMLHATSRFLRAGPGDARTIGAAASGAVLAAVVGFGAYDFGTLRASSETLWALGALGLVANEEMGVLRSPFRVRRPPVRMWFLAMLGSGVASIVFLVTPARSTIDAVFTTVDPRFAAAAAGDQAFTVKVLSQSACLVIEPVGPPGTVQCRDDDQLAGGIGNVRIEAGTDAEADRLFDAVEERLTSTFPAATLQARAHGRGWSAALVTAPLWAAAVGAAVGALIPVSPAGGAGSGPGAPGPAQLVPDRPRPRTATRPG